LHLCEKAGRLPPTAKAAVVKMIPKPRGGHRPIALFKAMFRMWGQGENSITRQLGHFLVFCHLHDEPHTPHHRWHLPGIRSQPAGSGEANPYS
jgi:hypothetical protein